MAKFLYISVQLQKEDTALELRNVLKRYKYFWEGDLSKMKNFHLIGHFMPYYLNETQPSATIVWFAAGPRNTIVEIKTDSFIDNPAKISLYILSKKVYSEEELLNTPAEKMELLLKGFESMGINVAIDERISKED